MSERRHDLLDRKRLSDSVQALHKAEQWEVYRILHAGGLKHTRNKYGLFFDVTYASDDVIDQVRSFVAFVHDSRSYMGQAEASIDGAETVPSDAPTPPHEPVRGEAPGENGAARCEPPLDYGAASDRVRLFVDSMLRLRDENPAMKRWETSRFQAYRKKYGRPSAPRAAPPCSSDHLQPEPFGDG